MRDGIAVAFSRRGEMVMRQLTAYARYLVRSGLVVGVLLLAAPCAAQEPDPPTMPATGEGRGALLAPSAWAVLSAPVQKQIGLKFTGFYIGALDTPVAQVDVPIRVAKFLTVTPSYMGYSVPARGLNRLPPQPGGFADSYREHQFRVDGTVAFAVRKLEISVRNMFVRRFRPVPAHDLNRYRGRVAIAHPIAVYGRLWKPFASYETFNEPHVGWNRHRIWSGVTLPVHKRVFVQPSYMWESSEGSRDVNYVLLGLIVNTR
jgi:hypothetical protein